MSPQQWAHITETENRFVKNDTLTDKTETGKDEISKEEWTRDSESRGWYYTRP